MITTDEPRKTARGSRGQVLVAWVLLLFAGDFYTIFIGTQPAWFAVLQAAVLLAVAGAFSFDPRLKPLCGFAIALAALDAGDFVRWTVESHLGWLSSTSLATQMFIDALLAGIPALLMLITALYSGLTLRQVFLVPGNMRASTSFPLLRSIRWTVVAPLLFLVTAMPLAGRLRILAVPGKMSSIALGERGTKEANVTRQAPTAADRSFVFCLLKTREGRAISRVSQELEVNMREREREQLARRDAYERELERPAKKRKRG